MPGRFGAVGLRACAFWAGFTRRPAEAALTADIREVYAEAKATGFDARVMRQAIRLRKMDRSQRQEHLPELCKRAVGLGD